MTFLRRRWPIALVVRTKLSANRADRHIDRQISATPSEPVDPCRVIDRRATPSALHARFPRRASP